MLNLAIKIGLFLLTFKMLVERLMVVGSSLTKSGILVPRVPGTDGSKEIGSEAEIM